MQSIKSVFRRPDLGLLILRVSVGAVFAINGYNKFMAGEKTLNAIGANIRYIGLDVGRDNVSTLFFGIAAAAAELIGGVLLAAGLGFRTSAVFLFITMLVATLMKIDTSGELNAFAYPMIMGLASLAMLFTGPGRYSLQRD